MIRIIVLLVLEKFGGRGLGLRKHNFLPIFITFYLFFAPQFRNVEDSATMSESNPKQQVQEIRIVAVVCGNRVSDTFVMMKSALIMSSCMIKFILFADEAATISLKRTVSNWPENILKRMRLDLRPITFPVDKAEEWKMLFKPCATQRLFLPVRRNYKINFKQIFYRFVH